MRIIEFFGNSEIQYKCRFPWSDNLYVQCRDEIWNIEEPGLSHSFEVYKGDYWFVGIGNTLENAEKNAWGLWEDISKCDHHHYIVDEDFPKGGAMCAMCNVFNRRAFNTGKDTDLKIYDA